MREKLIELLSFFADGYSVENRHIGDGTKVCEVADHLITNGVTLQSRDCYWATEQAYKNGYEKGLLDAVEVVHGRWIKGQYPGEYTCEKCGFEYCEADPESELFKYCPECGSKNE